MIIWTLLHSRILSRHILRVFSTVVSFLKLKLTCFTVNTQWEGFLLAFLPAYYDIKAVQNATSSIITLFLLLSIFCFFIDLHFLVIGSGVVVSQDYLLESHSKSVILGNAAILKCEIPSFVADFVHVTGWVDESTGLNYYPNNANFGTNRLSLFINIYRRRDIFIMILYTLL